MKAPGPARGARWITGLAGLAGLVGHLVACAEGAAPAERTLRDAFPAQASRVLDRGEGFAVSARGFTRRSRASDQADQARVSGGVDAELPRQGAGDVVLRVGGLELHVREAGGLGEGRLAGRAVVYPRRGGAAFWTADGPVVEEWIHAAPGEAADGLVAAWDVDGASLRQRGGAVELVDGAGAARVLVTAPAAFDEAGRPLRAALEARGARLELHVAPTAGAVLADPAWAPLFSAEMMEVPRADHVAVPLPDGRVLVAGGTTDGTAASAVAFAELYDASLLDFPRGGWTHTASMSTPRSDAAAALFYQGNVPRILVAGGTSGADLASAEVFDVVGGAWASAGVMSSPRSGHTATAIGAAPGAGPVLVVGGSNAGTALTSVDLFDGLAWTPGAPLSIPRRGHTATLLQDGTLLVAGGSGDRSAERYVPALAGWSKTGLMSVARAGHMATLLQDGTVLVAGGSSSPGGGALASAELYDPVAHTWSPTAAMSAARRRHTATRLADGTVLVAGGDDGTTTLASSERYDPTSHTWYAAAAMSGPRSHATATLLAGGAVLLAGGNDGATVSASMDFFDLQPLGADCAAPGECSSLHCGAGSCCATECASLDPCLLPACNAGTCTISVACDQTPCADPNPCVSAVCVGGVCQAQSLKVCPAQTDCHDGVCDAKTGACAEVPSADGTACDDHDACTANDVCHGGVCGGGTAVVCAAEDACHAAGTCDPKAGCSNPVLPACGPPVTSGSAANGALCAHDADCAYSHCVRGVCCDTACTKGCDSCALPASRGICTPEPAGTDLNEYCGFFGACGHTCGADGNCVPADLLTTCAPPRCLDAHHSVGAVLCASPDGGPLACSEASQVAQDCGRYACLSPIGACADGCRTVADCAPGSVCDEGFRCVAPPPVASGSDSGCQHAPGSPAGGGVASLLLALVWRRRARRTLARIGS